MHQSEIELITSYLKPHHNVFEWGCGGSTVYFSEYVQLYRSVEHNLGWYNNIKTLTSTKTNVNIIYKNNNKEYTDYINAIELFTDKYNIIIIDGRERVRCSIKARQYLDKDGLLFVHDFFTRPRYEPILEFYNLLSKIDDTPQTLGVFKLK